MNKMARYLNQLDSRLSQPKLHSPVRQSLNASQASHKRHSIEPSSPRVGFERRMMTNVKNRQQGSREIEAEASSPSPTNHNSRFERRGGSVIMKNNSMAELYNECSSKIVKPRHVNMRNSVNGAGGLWGKTAASSPSKTFDQSKCKRSDSIDQVFD